MSKNNLDLFLMALACEIPLRDTISDSNDVLLFLCFTVGPSWTLVFILVNNLKLILL
jgi:hypothetical protein